MATARSKSPRVPNLVKNDPYLAPFTEAIIGRMADAVNKEKELTGKNGSLDEFANAHNYFGLHRNPDGTWTFREWAPGATSICMIGDFSGWQAVARYELHRVGNNGVWEITLPADALHHGDFYKMYVSWAGGSGERLPAYATRVVQDPVSHLFAAQVWAPEPYAWQVTDFKPDTKPLLIYECHIGMAQEREGVGTYTEFRDKVLPRIHADGYNAIQIMAIQEHPYYGSFGYHVSNFFAASSRFGTPEELKSLIDTAHSMGIAVIMDIVHSHAVKNELEGLGRLDGSYDLYFYGDGRREHPAWDSLCFDYGKNEVIHFLLSNCKYWLEEYHFDGFRFDGVTSMLYYNHGLGQAFGSYDDYYNGGQDTNAITYLTLANKLIHTVNPEAITIAEEMSGMPGLAIPQKDGGIGFDYRMAMGIPDYWIKTLKEKKDEDWHPTSIFWELTNRRSDEKTISYVESHDQALVGDKTVIFRLPEWIDFPREGNGWSYKYARRQWDLVDRKELKYCYLNDFDNAMVKLIAGVYNFQSLPVVKLWEKDSDQVLAFRRGDLAFVFNFNPSKSFSGYGVLAPAGSYEVVLTTDNPAFGGYGNVDEAVVHHTESDPLYTPLGVEWLRLYLPARSAQVLRLRRSSAGKGTKTAKEAKPVKEAKVSGASKAKTATKAKAAKEAAPKAKAAKAATGSASKTAAKSAPKSAAKAAPKASAKAKK